MMKIKPMVFVSSTCFDLSQVRADIRDYLLSMGYEPLLSDYSSFPIDPDITAIENCLEAVEKHADIFVLVVGGRYGATDEKGKSVTNMEYLKAKEKGIPVYTFIKKDVLDALKIWKDNPDSDYKSIVDSTAVFKFIDTLRDKDNVWVLQFDTAQSITSDLTTQFAYLFSESLTEPLRDCRRLQFVRGWSHGQKNKVLARSTRESGSDGFRARERARIAVGDDKFDSLEDRVFQ